MVGVRTTTSLVSAGTERMLVDFGRANLAQKALQQPERVREVLDKARSDGVADTVAAVRSKLAQPLPLGYTSTGVVIEVGAGVVDVAVGDHVATNGPHAEFVAVPATMAARLPTGLRTEHGCFATVGAVALHAVRLAAPELGERFVVSGLGLVGLMAVQLLHANGCRVLGVDPNPARLALAARLGADVSGIGAAEEEAPRFSGGRGVDGVLICASSKSTDVVRSAARMCRRRGRVVLVGVAPIEIDRATFYERELTFQVSSAYGPGRYDASYEQGHDYPFGYVRWTAGRNMEAVLDQIAAGRLDVESLISHRFAFDDAPAAYDTLSSDPSALGIVLEYPTEEERPTADLLVSSVSTSGRASAKSGGLAVIGAGNFATRTLAPAIASAGGTVDTVVSRGGTSAAILARSLGARASSDVDGVIDDPSISSLFIATRHDSHASLASRAIAAGKHVYVEKPLAVDVAQLDEVRAAVEAAPELGVLAVGFNRRFAPFTVAMSDALKSLGGPKAVVITVNAGAIPGNHWTQDSEAGGGRIVGEACHFVDLARHLVAAPITDVESRYLESLTRDTATISLGFADGSTAHIHYFANGSNRYPKERVEVFAGGRVLTNDNYRTLRFHGWPKRRTIRSHRQDKGHAASVGAFLSATRGRAPWPIPLDELFEVSTAVLAAAD